MLIAKEKHFSAEIRIEKNVKYRLRILQDRGSNTDRYILIDIKYVCVYNWKWMHKSSHIVYNNKLPDVYINNKLYNKKIPVSYQQKF